MRAGGLSERQDQLPSMDPLLVRQWNSALHSMVECNLAKRGKSAKEKWFSKEGRIFNVKDKAVCNLIFNLQTVGSTKSSNSPKCRQLIETGRGDINGID